MSVPRLLKLSEIAAAYPHTPKLVDDYAVAMSKGNQFPPITCRSESGVFVLIDGHHRVAAARKLGHQYIQAFVR
jgi:ParB-like chromosome segregation protein Spo0J